ncbi:MAG: arylsulfotransferase family protein [Albidovulum sp.]
MKKLIFARVELWVLLLVVLIGFLAMVGFGALVLEGERKADGFGKLGQTAVAIAEIPRSIQALTEEDRRMAAFLPERFKDEPGGWTFFDGSSPRPSGYVLLSRHDRAKGHHVVELVSLADGTIKHDWQIDARALMAGLPGKERFSQGSFANERSFRAIHPYLTSAGQLVIKDHQSYLMGLDSCAQRVWVQDSVLAHHSTESDGAGGFWVPGQVEPHSIDEVAGSFVEDALVHVDGAGNILWQKSVPQIYLDHGMEYALFNAGRYKPDPLHLNDIEPVLEDGPYWRKGDLFLSFRHSSTVMLYRPASDEIVWMRQGPWLAQHDVDMIDDHRIAVFDNQTYEKGHGARIHGTNRIVVYDFATDEVSYPWSQAFEANDIKTVFEGLFTLLPGGEIFVEEENSGRILILGPDGGVVAQFINKGDNGLTYRLGWSRYMTETEGDAALATLTACGG